MKIEWRPIEIDDTWLECCDEGCPYLEKSVSGGQPWCVVFGQYLYSNFHNSVEFPARCCACRHSTKEAEGEEK